MAKCVKCRRGGEVGRDFVGKKDGTLCPCIDFRGLDAILVKDRYPLPLMNTMFEALHQAAISPNWTCAVPSTSAAYGKGMRHVRHVLQLLLESRLYVKLEKSEFNVPKASFLGFIVSKRTLAMDLAKTHAVRFQLCQLLVEIHPEHQRGGKLPLPC
ncbi:hypothetical protein NFI96_020507 [Prochilodus magdalenae]|nr:hypothetical protein NFI96_020507 [Prochilodus magdalenae]